MYFGVATEKCCLFQDFCKFLYCAWFDHRVLELKLFWKQFQLHVITLSLLMNPIHSLFLNIYTMVKKFHNYYFCLIIYFQYKISFTTLVSRKTIIFISFRYFDWLCDQEIITKGGYQKGELFQTLMMERFKSNDINDFDFRQVQQNIHEFENQCGYDETNYREVATTHNKNLDRRHQQQNKFWNNFPQKQCHIRKSSCFYCKHKSHIRVLLKLKHSITYAGNKYIKCFENWTELRFLSHLAEYQKF